MFTVSAPLKSCYVTLITAALLISAVSCNGPAPEPPAAPGSPFFLDAYCPASSQILVFWMDNIYDKTSTATRNHVHTYKLIRSLNSNFSSSTEFNVGSANYYLDGGVTDGTKYFYKLTGTVSISGAVTTVNSNSINKTAGSAETDTLIRLSFTMGSADMSYPIIYVSWLEKSATEVQNLVVCARLYPTNDLTYTGLPYWAMNKKGVSSTVELDAVTQATKKDIDFAFYRRIKPVVGKQFSLNFEADHSFDPNDWFSNQPAILYTASIDLDLPANDYILAHTGWTPNEGTANVIPGTPAGTPQTETHYITNLKVGGGFGGTDSRSSTNMVLEIKATLIRP